MSVGGLAMIRREVWRLSIRIDWTTVPDLVTVNPLSMGRAVQRTKTPHANLFADAIAVTQVPTDAEFDSLNPEEESFV